MLDPDYLQTAADSVTSIYSAIEAEAISKMSDMMLSGGTDTQWMQTRLLLLSQSCPQEVLAIIAQHRAELSDAVVQTVEDAITKSDLYDRSVMEAGLGVSAVITPNALPLAISTTISQVTQILQRDNLSMADGARTAFLGASTKAITRVNAGVVTADKAMREAVADLWQSGVKVVDYESGVHNQVDVAVRRHIITQLHQTGGALTKQRMEDNGCNLVEVSSHLGARPSHRDWQGRIYSLGAAVQGYRTIADACGYGRVDGLMGANCRHSYSPWKEGWERRYSPTPDEDAGYDPDEIYALRQKQRGIERQIRDTKRKRDGLDAAGLDSTAERVRLRTQQAKMREFLASNEGKHLQRDPKRESVQTTAKYGSSSAAAATAKSVRIGREVSVPGGGKSRLVEEMGISDEEVFAGPGSSRELRVKEFLAGNYGGDADKWQHKKGHGYVYDENGKPKRAMIHWFEEEAVGIVELKVKGWSKKQ